MYDLVITSNDHGYLPFVQITSRTFHQSWLLTGYVAPLTRWVLLVDQELLILPEHLSSPPVASGFLCARFLRFCGAFSILLFVCLLHLAIVLSVIRYTHFVFSEIAVNGNCKASGDSYQCADEHAECRDDTGYKCLCKDTYYIKDKNCAPRM